MNRIESNLRESNRIEVRILCRTDLERELMMPPIGGMHFYVKKGGPKKVLKGSKFTVRIMMYGVINYDVWCNMV